MDNPFLQPDFEVKWSLMTPEAVEPAIDYALERAREALRAIRSLPLEEVSYAAVAAAFEEALETVVTPWRKVNHLKGVADSKALRKVHGACLPKVTEFYAKVFLDGDTYARFEALSQSAEMATLSAAKQRYVRETLKDFMESGAALGAEKKESLLRLRKELAADTQKFSEQVVDARNAFERIVEDEAELAGLPENALQLARQSAAKKGYGSEEKPVYRFTLETPSYLAVMKHAENRALRKELYEAFHRIGREGDYDNRELMPKILRARTEIARILGKAHHADVVLTRQMAKSGDKARAFLDGLQDRVSPSFEREVEELMAFRKEVSGEEGSTFEPWDLRYWETRLKKERFDFDSESLRPYLGITQVLKGMFRLSEKLFGIVITEREENRPEVWHEDVRFYDVHDEGGRHLGSFYADWFPRETKEGGAWMDYLITGAHRDDGPRDPHLGMIHGNLTPPVGGRPALLDHEDVETIFHEFGHLLHHLLGDVEVRSLNGVNVALDFVELPSQIMENWCWERAGLDFFARHFETGEAIPDDLFARLLKTRNFGAARTTMRQLNYGVLDLELHMNRNDVGADEILDVVAEISKPFTVPTRSEAGSIATQFTHIFGAPVGYAGGYYSYKWSEVLDADAFSRFRAEGVLNGSTGREFREKVLSRGASEDPEVLFRDFMGRDPDPEALLVRSGLTAGASG